MKATAIKSMGTAFSTLIKKERRSRNLLDRIRIILLSDMPPVIQLTVLIALLFQERQG